MDRDDPVETFTAKSSDHPLAEGVRFGASRRRFENFEAEPCHCGIELRREDRIAVVEQIASRVVGRQGVAELLDYPVCGGMRGRSGVDDASRSDLDQDECVDGAPSNGRGDDEVAGDDGVGVVAHERAPALIVATAPATRAEKLPNGSGRDTQTELEPQLVGNPPGSPGWVVGCQPLDQRAQIGRNRRAAAAPRLPSPKRADSCTLPPNERGRLDHNERVAPAEESRCHGEQQTVARVRPSRSLTARQTSRVGGEERGSRRRAPNDVGRGDERRNEWRRR